MKGFEIFLSSTTACGIKMIKGVPIDENGKEIKFENELQYFHECSKCHKLVDRRDLGEVIYHEKGDCNV